MTKLKGLRNKVRIGVIRTGYLAEPEKHTLDGGQPLLPQVYKLIGCELVEVVRLPGDSVLMLVDEEGLLHDKPANSLATLLSGQVIVGDAAVVNERDFR